MGNDAPSDQPAPRPGRRPRDLVISLLVLLVPVLLLVGGYQLLAGRTAPVSVDPAAEVAAARANGLAARAPAGLDADWVPINATFQPADGGGTLRIGYVTPSGGSAQLVQSNLPADQLLAAELPTGATPAGSVQVGGAEWQRYQATDQERALVRLRPEQTVLAFGAATEAELTALAAALS